MEIICHDLEELKLLVLAINPTLISKSDKYASGWGGAGVIVADSRIPYGANIVPLGGPKDPGVLLNTDKVIITQYPHEFSWFMERILRMEPSQDVNIVELYNHVPYAHLDYIVNKKDTKDIKGELLFICDWLIDYEKRKREEDNNCK